MTTNIKLKAKWSCWLQLKTNTKSHASYLENQIELYKITEFKELFYFLELSKFKNISNFFYNVEKNQEKLIKNNKIDNKIIDSFLFFKDGVKPNWEDPVNKNGGHFLFELKNIAKSEFDDIYKNLIIKIVGNSFKETFKDNIVGFRILDRLIYNKTIKLEIWLDLSKKDTDFNEISENIKTIEEMKQEFELFIKAYFNDYLVGSTYFEDHHKMAAK